MTLRNFISLQASLALLALIAAIPAAAESRIRLRDGGDSPDTIVIDETSNPPMLTVTAGISVRAAAGSLADLGGGQYEILVAGDAAYHLKSRGGIDSVTVLDGPGNSTYWLGVGAESDSVVIYDGPGDDRYKIEGKGGDDVYQIFDDSGDGDDDYHVKGAKGADQIEFTDGPGDDLYSVKASPDASLVITDESGGDVDLVRTKGVQVTP